MRPVDQLFLVDRDGRGDCLRACVASVLELSPGEVPDFSMFGWLWLDALALFCDVETVVPHEASGFWIANGRSPRGGGVRHSVVFHEQELAHDPHPSRAGLLGNPDGGLVIKGLRQNSRERIEKARGRKESHHVA